MLSWAARAASLTQACWSASSRFAPLRRCSGQVGDELVYEEQRQKADIKSNEFYEAEGHKRHYFYYVDLLGRLFLEDTTPKNIATSMKSDKFLRFFFRRVRRNASGLHNDYPFTSPCGKEMNFIKPADTAIVFERLEGDTLIAAGGLRVPFQPTGLYMGPGMGRMYHAADALPVGGVALVRSHCAIALAEELELFTEQEEAAAALAQHGPAWQAAAGDDAPHAMANPEPVGEEGSSALLGMATFAGVPGGPWPVWDVRVHPGHTVCREFWPDTQ